MEKGEGYERAVKERVICCWLDRQKKGGCSKKSFPRTGRSEKKESIAAKGKQLTVLKKNGFLTVPTLSGGRKKK